MAHFCLSLRTFYFFSNDENHDNGWLFIKKSDIINNTSKE